MGSAATATPLYETKPTIKTSYSTNRKGKRDETKTETKRWKRKNEGREENHGTNQSVVHDFALYDTGQHGEPSNKSSKKVWTRFKLNNSNPLLVSTKTKKGKGKMKKSKPISPVKSSSSHKTIILSEHENELDNLKELNRMCEDNVSYNQDSSEEFNEMGQCYEVPSDLQTNSDLNHVFCDAISTGENVSDADDIVCKEFDNFPTDASCIFKLSTTDLEKMNSTVNDKRLETELNNSNAKKHPIKSKPLSWIISLSPSNSELSLENEIADLNNRDQISNDNLSEVIKIEKIDEVNDKNALLNEENECSNITNTQVNDVKIDGFAETNTDFVLSINNESIENAVDVFLEEDVKEESLHSDLKLCSRNSNKSADKKSSPVSGVLTDANGLTGAGSAACYDVLSSIYSLCPDVNTTSSKNLQGFSLKFSELSENNRITESSARKSKCMTDCECNKIIKVIKSQLKLLSECKCLVHNNSVPLTFGSCDENTVQYDDFVKFSKLGKSRNKHLPHQLFKKADRNYLNRSSYSDSEVLQKERSSKQLCFALEKKHSARAKGAVDHCKKKLKCLPASKNECPKDVLNQTSGKSDSENGSVSSVQCVNKFPHNYITQSQNGFEASTRELGKGSTSKKVSNNFSMGERLRDVRRLLNRSVEAQSTDSFDCVEEDRSTLNDSLPEISAQFEMEEIGNSMQYPNNQNNAVIFTSVQRLSNPREKLNRRIALREWQLGQSGCTPLISGTWQQVEDEVNRGWKTFSRGDVLSSLPQSTLIHLPPLGNSTPKRLNRRWSPSGGEQITGGGTGAQDDSALSKFCHECGGRYPVAGAKFCCLCGVRRLAI